MTARSAQDWNKPPALPASHFTDGRIYRDDAIFAEEQERIFSKIWKIACHESEIPKPGDFRTVEQAGVPLVVVRGEDSAVRTFVNVCSHRGARIVHEASGNAKRFTCFYHLWAYDSRGACVAIPRADAYETAGLDKSKLGLRAVRTETRLGLVFINLDDNAMPLAEYLVDALEAFEEVLTVNDLQVFTYQHATVEANWKEWQETNLDLYHEYMHVALRRTQTNPAAMAERELFVYPNGHIRGGGAGYKANYKDYKGWEGRSDSHALKGLTAADFRFTHLFPNSAMNARGTVMRISTFTPLSTHRTRIEWRGLGPKGQSAEDWKLRSKHYAQYWGPFGRNVPEDLLAAELCEWNFRNGAAKYQLLAREEGMRGQDDGFLRAFYAQWGRLMGRTASDPFGDSKKNG